MTARGEGMHGGQTCVAAPTQNSSQATAQHSGSIAHTDSQHETSAQKGVALRTQQSEVPGAPQLVGVPPPPPPPPPGRGPDG
jgi:hypothetical protein